MSNKKPLSKRIRSNIIILVSFVFVIIYCMNLLRSILWKNNNEMGLALVKNYCSVEEETLHTCEIVLNLCADYITEREKAGIPAAELREGLYPLMNGLTDAYGRDMIQIYGKLSHDTGLVSNDPAIESMTDYDVSTAGWHQGAAAADGELYLSPAYIDAASGLPVVTMCRLIPDTGSFLAIDLKPSCFRIDSSHVELPARASYYLTDGEGTLLYYLSSWDYKPEELQVLVNNYRENAVCDTSDHVMENVMASDGIVRNIFFHHMDNGWTGILTIPKDESLSGAHIYRNISILLIGLGIVLVILQGFREYKSMKAL